MYELFKITKDEKYRIAAYKFDEIAHFTAIYNDVSASFEVEKGYALVHHHWKNNDVIDVSFDIEVSYSTLPDNANTYAYTYGPLVLSAGFGNRETGEI